MKDAVARPIELNAAMMEFLESAATQYGLPDAGKAIRCLVNYARENPDKGQDIFGEFRCLDC